MLLCCSSHMTALLPSSAAVVSSPPKHGGIPDSVSLSLLWLWGTASGLSGGSQAAGQPRSGGGSVKGLPMSARFGGCLGCCQLVPGRGSCKDCSLP